MRSEMELPPTDKLEAPHRGVFRASGNERTYQTKSDQRAPNKQCGRGRRGHIGGKRCHAKAWRYVVWRL